MVCVLLLIQWFSSVMQWVFAVVVSLTSPRSIGLLLLNHRITIACSLVVVVPVSPAREETLQHCLPLVVGNRLVHISCWSVISPHILLFLFVSFDLFCLSVASVPTPVKIRRRVFTRSDLLVDERCVSVGLSCFCYRCPMGFSFMLVVCVVEWPLLVCVQQIQSFVFFGRQNNSLCP